VNIFELWRTSLRNELNPRGVLFLDDRYLIAVPGIEN
jgi:hypothetical protein